MTDRDERNSYGALTEWALAFDALSDYGCDCGDDEPGTCLACVCGRAMRTERARAEKAEAEVARLAARIEELVAGVAAGKSAALLTRIEVLSGGRKVGILFHRHLRYPATSFACIHRLA